mmetsp:Transcript_22390/g.31218  ORF Transcript_22390/g.31218 Transcript_22390/m.31218 type:complete len:148 (+) Transcript_22390:480-923(+)
MCAILGFAIHFATRIYGHNICDFRAGCIYFIIGIGLASILLLGCPIYFTFPYYSTLFSGPAHCSSYALLWCLGLFFDPPSSPSLPYPTAGLCWIRLSHCDDPMRSSVPADILFEVVTHPPPVVVAGLVMVFFLGVDSTRTNDAILEA